MVYFQNNTKSTRDPEEASNNARIVKYKNLAVSHIYFPGILGSCEQIKISHSRGTGYESGNKKDTQQIKLAKINNT